MKFKSLALVVVSCSVVAGQAVDAQEFPSHPIRLIVPFAPGSITDFGARQIARELNETLKQPLVVENRPGAGGVIAVREVVNAKPDGYTLLVGTSGTQVANRLLYKALPYDPDTQLMPIGLATRTPPILAVRTSLPVTSMAELVSYVGAHPGELNYGVAGGIHFGLETLKAAYALDMVRIQYKGSGEAVAAGAAGQVDIVMDGAPSIMPHVKSGKLRALAVMSDAQLDMAPGVPTVTSLGAPELQSVNWTALYAPAGTPPQIIGKLNQALQQALQSPDLKQRVSAYGTQLFKGTLAEHEQFLKSEKARGDRLVKAANIRPE